MVSLNKVLVIGNLTRDPELRYTPQGTAVATLGMALNSSFKDKSGQTQKDTCFINVVAWAHLAEICNQYLQKGSPVFVEGRLKSRSWQNSEGQNRSVLEVVATSVQFMPRGVPRPQDQDVDLGSQPQDFANSEDQAKETQGTI